MLYIALVFLCTAQIIQFSRHWLVVSADTYSAHQDNRLRNHLDWSRPRRSPRIAAARF